MSDFALELRQVSKRFTQRRGLLGGAAREHLAVDRVDLALPRRRR